MAFEAQWPSCLQAELEVPGLPSQWSGVTVLHLTDVHAGLFATNERSLEKVVSWAAPLEPDLVVLTGDVLGDPVRSARTVDLLRRLRPPLGMFAVTGNHEYGLGKGPFARARDVSGLWTSAGAALLRDACVALPDRAGFRLVLCGADYLTGGFGFLERCRDGRLWRSVGRARVVPLRGSRPGRPNPGRPARTFPSSSSTSPRRPTRLSRPSFRWPSPGTPTEANCAFPAPVACVPLVNEEGGSLAGVYEWGEGRLVVSRGVGTSFLPFRLLTRPEATLWRLV